MMAINMELEWEKMENLKSSYEAAGKMEVLKAAWAAFSEQMQSGMIQPDSPNWHSLDDYLFFFEYGGFPEQGLSSSEAVAAAGQ